MVWSCIRAVSAVLQLLHVSKQFLHRNPFADTSSWGSCGFQQTGDGFAINDQVDPKKSFTKTFMWKSKQHNNLFDLNISCYGTDFAGSASIIILHLITALPWRCSCLKTKRTVLDLWLLTSKPCKQQKYVKSHPVGFCGAINNKHVCSSLSCVYHTGLI